MPPMHLCDTHCHLFMAPMEGDPRAVLERAAAAGVGLLVVPAYDLGSWPRVAALVEDHPGRVFGAYGLHPWEAGQADALRDEDLAARLDGAVAVGEVGLDFALDEADPEAQIALLRRQLALGRDLDLPVILHCRKAFDALLEILDPFVPGLRGVVHAFSRGPELAARLEQRGLHLGFGGAVTRPRAKRARRSLVTARQERILLETDAPSIGLDGVAPPAVEPRHVAEVARAAAALRGCSPEEIARLTTENARALFALP